MTKLVHKVVKNIPSSFRRNILLEESPFFFEDITRNIVLRSTTFHPDEIYLHILALIANIVAMLHNRSGNSHRDFRDEATDKEDNSKVNHSSHNESLLFKTRKITTQTIYSHVLTNKKNGTITFSSPLQSLAIQFLLVICLISPMCIGKSVICRAIGKFWLILHRYMRILLTSSIILANFPADFPSFPLNKVYQSVV